MIHLLMRVAIHHQAKEQKAIIPDNYLEILQKYERMKCPKRMKIKFSWLFDIMPHILNSHVFFNKYIVMNSKWATRLLLCDDDETNNAFNITVGHEITHTEDQFCPFKFGIKSIKFIAWVNEVQADFGGTEKMADGSREKLLASIEYKKKLHIDSSDTNSHPSWDRREKYAREYDFDSELVRKIAEDVGFNDQKIIDRVCEHYKEIILQ